MSQTVYLKSNHLDPKTVYHTDPDCPSLKRCKRYREVDRAVLFDDLRECYRCAGADYSSVPETPRNGYTGPKGVSPSRCHSCGADKPVGAPCAFCERFDTIEGIPPEVDLAWLRTFAGAVSKEAGRP